MSLLPLCPEGQGWALLSKQRFQGTGKLGCTFAQQVLRVLIVPFDFPFSVTPSPNDISVFIQEKPLVYLPWYLGRDEQVPEGPPQVPSSREGEGGQPLGHRPGREGKLAGLSLRTPAVGRGLAVCLQLACCLILATLTLCQKTQQRLCRPQTADQTLSRENLLFKVTSLPVLSAPCPVQKHFLLGLKESE